VDSLTQTFRSPSTWMSGANNTGVHKAEAPQRNPLQGLNSVSRDGGI
jgi:hypothetical protein